MQEKADAAYLAARSMPASKEAMFGDDFEAAVGTQNLLMRLGYRVRGATPPAAAGGGSLRSAAN